MTLSTGKYLKRVNGTPFESFQVKYKIVNSGCWEWQGSLNIESGYGQLNIRNGKIITAHKFSYITYIGEIPKGLFVCHSCDNRKCCSPFHLFLGTNADNMKDASNKGRLTNGFQHPSVYHYRRKGCRCNECRECYSAYCRWTRRNVVAAPVQQPVNKAE